MSYDVTRPGNNPDDLFKKSKQDEKDARDLEFYQSAKARSDFIARQKANKKPNFYELPSDEMFKVIKQRREEEALKGLSKGIGDSDKESFVFEKDPPKNTGWIEWSKDGKSSRVQIDQRSKKALQIEKLSAMEQLAQNNVNVGKKLIQSGNVEKGNSLLEKGLGMQEKAKAGKIKKATTSAKAGHRIATMIEGIKTKDDYDEVIRAAKLNGVQLPENLSTYSKDNMASLANQGIRLDKNYKALGLAVEDEKEADKVKKAKIALERDEIALAKDRREEANLQNKRTSNELKPDTNWDEKERKVIQKQLSQASLDPEKKSFGMNHYDISVDEAKSLLPDLAAKEKSIYSKYKKVQPDVSRKIAMEILVTEKRGLEVDEKAIVAKYLKEDGNELKVTKDKPSKTSDERWKKYQERKVK